MKMMTFFVSNIFCFGVDPANILMFSNELIFLFIIYSKNLLFLIRQWRMHKFVDQVGLYRS